MDRTLEDPSIASETKTPDTPTIASEDSTHDTPTVASEDSTHDTSTQASEDSTPDTPTIANVDSTHDTLTIANVDSTHDTLTIANVDSTHDTSTQASEDSTPDSPTIANVDSTHDTSTQASEDSTPDTPTIANVDSTSDTLTLASVDRDNQGLWEFEYSYGGEADLHRQYDKCKKNPGHENFIPVDKFSIEDLPEDYRHKDVVDYIRAVSDLTVRVSVKYVSDKRPATAPGSRKSYPGYKVRGRRMMTVGTGWVSNVEVYNDSAGDACKCKDCRTSSCPNLDFAAVNIITANHVVFDALEGEHTTCHLFFDRGSRPDTCSGVVTLTGMFHVDSNFTEDYCYMKHYTHDLDLARRLRQTIEKMLSLRETIIFDKKCLMCLFKQRLSVLDKQPLLFIVSHPHGCSKQVSLGYFTSACVFNNTIVSLLYNTATCPGSSGAHMFVYQNFSILGLEEAACFSMAAHCGSSREQLEVNFCRINGGSRTHKLVTLETLQLNKGPWQDNLCCVDEEDQNQHYAACKKNPGHENFFPVEKFSMDNLPPFYRSDDVMQFIKLTSDLTVRVSVKYVSEERPETVPGTDTPNPLFNGRVGKLTRVGTGWINYAKIDGKLECTCKECQNSPKPKSPRAYIKIQTAAHLVYDEQEAEASICHLFFDSGERPDVCESIVTLRYVNSFFNNVVRDTSEIKYFTHDLDLVRNLQNIISNFDDVLHSLNINDIKTTRCVKQNSGQEAEQEPPLHIIVSHPHGCAKHVGICYTGSQGNIDTGSQGNIDTAESQCSHSSIVCPGSSGAAVIDMSRKLVYPFVE